MSSLNAAPEARALSSNEGIGTYHEKRTARGWTGLMVKGLPEFQTPIKHPRYAEFTDLRKYRVLPALLLLTVFGLAVAVRAMLATTGPHLSGSSTEAAGAPDALVLVMRGVVALIAVALIAFLVVAGPRRAHEYFYEASLHEEILFRRGSENFTPLQKVRACLQSTFANPAALILLIATLGTYLLPSVVFMWVYLREMKASGDDRRAVATSTMFQATFHAWACCVVAVLGAASVALWIFA